MAAPESAQEWTELLVCPACKGKLAPAPGGRALDCPACRLRFTITDGGIPVMLVAEAVPIP